MVGIMKTLKTLNIDNTYVLLLEDRRLEEIQKELKGTLSDLEWNSWKMYRKSVQLIRKQFEKGVFSLSEEMPAWLTLELTIPILKKHLSRFVV